MGLNARGSGRRFQLGAAWTATPAGWNSCPVHQEGQQDMPSGSAGPYCLEATARAVQCDAQLTTHLDSELWVQVRIPAVANYSLSATNGHDAALCNIDSTLLSSSISTAPGPRAAGAGVRCRTGGRARGAPSCRASSESCGNPGVSKGHVETLVSAADMKGATA